MNPPAIIAKTCGELAEQLASQPEFFERHRDDVPLSEREMPKERYTGVRSNDEHTNLVVGAMWLLGMSMRAIEREAGVDRRTIPHRVAWLESTGRIPAQKERLAQKVGALAECSAMTLNALLGRVQAGEFSVDLSSTIKAVATLHGITVEKFQLLMGQPTEILQTMAPRQGRAEIEEYYRTLEISATVTPLERPAIESESSAGPSIPAGIGALAAPGYPDATSGPASASLADAITPPVAAVSSEGAGGVASARPGEKENG